MRTFLRIAVARVRGWLGQRRRDAELGDEIQAHLDLLTDEYVRRGMTPRDAGAAARREFGGVQHITEIYRDQRGLPSLDSFLQDLRYTWRTLRRSPGFTAAAVLSLALGIGANTAIFSLINAALLRMLPVRDPHQLVLLAVDDARGSDESFSYPLYEQFRDANHVLTALAASGGSRRMRLTVRGSSGASTGESVVTETVSGNFFSALGVDAAAGRTLSADDDRAGDPQSVAVISDAFWERRFGRDPGAVGAAITIEDVPFTIVGVAPRRFFGFEVGRSPDLWWPLQMYARFVPGTPRMTDRGVTWLRLIGRLQAGVSAMQAQSDLDLIFQRELSESVQRGATRPRLGLQPAGTGWTRLRKQFTEPLVIMMIVVGLVLLIACANVANLLLARATARRREIAVRLALGAGRSRLVRQLLTESVVLALAGGALGATLARWGAGLLLLYVPEQVSLDLSPDARVLAFVFGVSVLTSVLFGLVPAFRATRVAVTPALKEHAGLGGAARSRLALNKLLVVSQVALSLFLLIGAGLFIRTLQNLKALDPGFTADHLTVFSLDTPRGYDSARRTALSQRLRDRLEALPGARAASLSLFGLLGGDGWGNKVVVQGYVPKPDENLRCFGTQVGPRYFETMGMTIVAGRDIVRRDVEADAPQVAVVNQTMARYFFSNENPIGRRFSFPARLNDTFEIVGVVKDTKYATLRERTPRAFYVPFARVPRENNAVFELRSAGSAATPDALRRVVQDLDPKLDVRDVRAMADVVDASLIREHFVAKLAGAFSLLALLLASIGLYGVMSYGVARRTSEIALRVALGARRHHVVWMVLRDDLSLVAAGFALGLPAAFAASRLVETLLFDVRATDPAIAIGATAAMIVVGALAGYLPALRATRIEPTIALRTE